MRSSTNSCATFGDRPDDNERTLDRRNRTSIRERHPDDSAIPDAVMDDPRFSLIAKGLYSLVLAHQGQPINPNEDAIEDVEDVRVAVEELVDAGLVVRVAAT